MLGGGAEDVGRGAGRKQRKLPGGEPSPAAHRPKAGACSGRGALSADTHWVPGSNTNQGKDRHVRKRQGLQGTGWTLQTRGKAFGDSSPCTINDQGTGSPRSLSNAGAEKGRWGIRQRSPG